MENSIDYKYPFWDNLDGSQLWAAIIRDLLTAQKNGKPFTGKGAAMEEIHRKYYNQLPFKKDKTKVKFFQDIEIQGGYDQAILYCLNWLNTALKNEGRPQTTLSKLMSDWGFAETDSTISAHQRGKIIDTPEPPKIDLSILDEKTPVESEEIVEIGTEKPATLQASAGKIGMGNTTWIILGAIVLVIVFILLRRKK